MEIIDLLKALLTPIIAIVTTFIAVQQYRIQKTKIKFELYAPRKEIYDATMLLFRSVSGRGTLTNDEIDKFNEDTRMSYFLFNGRLRKHLFELSQRGRRIQMISNRLGDGNLPQDGRLKYIEQCTELIEWYESQNEIIQKLFKRFLKLS